MHRLAIANRQRKELRLRTPNRLPLTSGEAMWNRMKEHLRVLLELGETHLIELLLAPSKKRPINPMTGVCQDLAITAQPNTKSSK